MSKPLAEAELMVAPPPPIVIPPAYVLLPLTLSSAPVGLAAKPVPLIVSGIVDIGDSELVPAETLFWSSNAAPELMVTPDEAPSAVLFCTLIRPALICTGPEKVFAPSNMTNPVPVFVMPVAPPIPIVLVPVSLNEYATELLLNDTEAGTTPLAWITT